MAIIYQKIYPGVVNKVVCQKCLRENEISVDSSTRQHFTFTCVCTCATKYFVVNRRKSERLPADGFGTCWLGKDERGMTVKISDFSDQGLGMTFFGRKMDIKQKINDNGKGRVIYSKNGEVVSSPQKIVFRNIRGLRAGAEFVPDGETGRGGPFQNTTGVGSPAKTGKQTIARMKCRACGDEIVEKVNSFKSVEISCPNCGAVFSIDANRRKTPRINVSYPGRVSDLAGEIHNIHVRNISRKGVCFTLLETNTHAFNKKEPLKLSFFMSNKRIGGKVIITSFSGANNVHASFKNYDMHSSI